MSVPNQAWAILARMEPRVTTESDFIGANVRQGSEEKTANIVSSGYQEIIDKHAYGNFMQINDFNVYHHAINYNNF